MHRAWHLPTLWDKRFCIKCTWQAFTVAYIEKPCFKVKVSLAAAGCLSAHIKKGTIVTSTTEDNGIGHKKC